MTGSASSRRRPGQLYRPLSAVVVRAPLLPSAAVERVSWWWPEPEVRLAVSVASPDLVAALPDADPAAGRAGAALQRYLIRAATRPTPFGLFAAAGVARWGDVTDLAIRAGRRPTQTRPDMAWLTKVAQRFTTDPECRSWLRVFTNPCVLAAGDRFHLADPGTGGTRGGPDVSVRATRIVRQVLAAARAGARWDALQDLILRIAPAGGPVRAGRLLEQLFDQQFLVPELLPTLTGDPLAHLLKGLEQAGDLPAAADGVAQLRAVQASCRRVDASDPGTAVAELHALRGQLARRGPVGRRADVQLDSALPLQGTVTRRIAEDAAAAAALLIRLHPDPAWAPLSAYRSAFHRRYGIGGRVPLLELLDPRLGLGPPEAHPAGDRSGHAETSRAATLRALVTQAHLDGRLEVVLDDVLLDRLSTWDPDSRRLPPSLELSLLAAARSRSGLDRGDYLLVVGPNLGAQAAGRGLGRFADLIGAPALDLLAEAASAEESVAGGADPAGPVVAEMVYRPLNARSGNVAIRPLVRRYELPIGVAPTLAADRVVRVDELSVRLSGGRFQVWWDRLGRPLLLSAGHMLNSAGAPSICRALLALTSDGTVQLAPFDWGPMATMPVLPRVRHGRVVLAPAQWRVSRETAGPGDWVAAWRKRWRVPRRVYLTFADQRLLLDLDDPAQCTHLDAALREHRTLTVQEALPAADDAWLPGPRGGHLAELVVPLVLTRPPPAAPSAPRRDLQRCADRRRGPGSEWLYLNLDGPERTENAALTGTLGELAESMARRGDVRGWFFVRYSDPRRHLRLRLTGEPEVLLGQVLPELCRWGAEAMARGERTGLSVQVYERELDRYGGPVALAVCEALACADSSAVRDLLPVAGRVELVELGLVSLADLLNLLAGHDPGERARWAGELARGTIEAGPLFRERKEVCRALLRATGDASWAAAGAGWAASGPLVSDVLARRRAAMAPLVEELSALIAEGTCTATLPDLAASILHLHANRLGLNQAAERMALGLLARTQRSLVAHG